jgi:ribosomal protein S18 acetylase RimI-like enzyme
VIGALARTVDFQTTLAHRSATRVQPSAGGFAVRHHRYPASYQHNQLYVLEPVELPALLADADRLLADAGHREVTVLDDAIGLELAPGLTAAGYVQGRLTAMIAAAEPTTSIEIRVQSISAEELRPVLTGNWRRTLPNLGEDELRQLVDRSAATEAACQLTRLGVCIEGAVAAWCELYEIGPTAQIENVVTLPEWRNRGFARALMAEAARRAGRSGCDLVFLLADLDDWPRHLYHRLGFREVGRSHVFARDGSARAG